MIFVRDAARLAAFLVLTLLAIPLTPAAVHAQGISGGTREGTIAPTPIAIPFFISEDPKLGQDVAAVVAADLGNSGLFKVLDPTSYLEQVRDVNTAPNFANWRAIQADALSVGKVSRSPDGRLVSEFRLWDVVNGKQKAGQRFATTAQNWRRIGHLIADQIYEQLTGEKGYFDTRVVYVDETGPKEKRTKRLAIMDQDGANVRLLSQGKDLVADPALQSRLPGNHLHGLPG